MNKVRATIICCYNSKVQFESFLNSTLNQTEVVSIIGVNNTNKTFSSCSLAYNSVMHKIDTQYVVFSHQDIMFYKKDSLKRFIDYLEKINDYNLSRKYARRFEFLNTTCVKAKTGIIHRNILFLKREFIRLMKKINIIS